MNKQKKTVKVDRYFTEILSIELPFIDSNQRKVVHEDETKIYFDDGSVYHKDNKLNELTNKEWIKFQKSWFILRPKPREENVMLHPAKFPEELVSEFIRFFTKSGQTVIDPMVGTGSTLISCVETGRNGIGIELSYKYAEIAKTRLINKQVNNLNNLFANECKKVKIKLFVGDAFHIDKLNLKNIDYCITSPPYWDMLREKGFETQLKRKQKNLDVFYSDSPDDLGNISNYEQFLDKLTEIYKKVYNVLKKGAYMTIIVKNIKKKNKMYPLAWNLAERLSSFFSLKDEKIWCQDDVKLAPYGYKNAWVSNTVHHYCLNFRKEK